MSSKKACLALFTPQSSRGKCLWRMDDSYFLMDDFLLSAKV
jgi:hypothetical protein